MQIYNECNSLNSRHKKFDIPLKINHHLSLLLKVSGVRFDTLMILSSSTHEIFNNRIIGK